MSFRYGKYVSNNHWRIYSTWNSNGNEIFKAGQLLGSKLILNEFVAYEALGAVITSLSYRTGLILSESIIIVS
ncbi:nucleoside transporter C-terminal domain-containing protein [uncultured Clostridium sp.]|uniref:nucleoside transporter C-terminal domain-containing protein n=1 Tax=uncultured Clostridium sp. TaxID=59620 RepID=UPI003459573E